MVKRPRLLFVSTRFLYPVDSGGKIRTTQILRGMKEDADYEIVLVSPATPEELSLYANDLPSVCDEFLSWPQKERGRLFNVTRMRHLVSSIPIPVRTDFDTAGAALISKEIERADVVVFDFLHAAVLTPSRITKPSVLFTHNVEAEIFERHVKAASNPAFRWIWNNQYQKMLAYERDQLSRFDVVVAVSERDADKFRDDYGTHHLHCIPTGVDLDFFSYQAPSRANAVVFCGSMDWMANQDGVEFFLDSVWPIIHEKRPEATFTVVGRNPPNKLLEKAKRFGPRVTFTGFVDDVRDHIAAARVNVIPLRVGGGTRRKVYEAMAIGTPIVSTQIGVEGLPVKDGVHYRCADDAHSFADATIELLDNEACAMKIAEHARKTVEEQFSYRNAAKEFARACEISSRRFNSSCA